MYRIKKERLKEKSLDSRHIKKFSCLRHYTGPERLRSETLDQIEGSQIEGFGCSNKHIQKLRGIGELFSCSGGMSGVNHLFVQKGCASTQVF